MMNPEIFPDIPSNTCGLATSAFDLVLDLPILPQATPVAAGLSVHN